MMFGKKMLLCISMVLSLIGISAADYGPLVYGDANQDGQIDLNDVDYVAGIISGTKEGTKLSDANYDGKVDASDILQIERIIRGNQTNLTLLDMDGRSVTIPQPANRVLAIGFGFIENAMFALGVENEAVGTGGANSPTARYLNPELSKLPDVGTIAKGINYETVAAVNPDLVIIRKNVYFQEGGDKTVDMIEKLDMPAIVLRDPNHFHTSDITTIYQEIGLLGRIFNKTVSAQELINKMDERITSITERTKDIKEDDRPKALFCALANSNTREKKGGVVVVWAKECASTFADLLNIKSAYEGTGRNYLSAEQVLNLNPDVIIVETGGMLNLSQLYDDNDEYFKNIREMKAIQERRVSSIGNLTYYGDIQLELPVMLMIEAKSVYPEKFSDVKVSEWIDRYYEEIYKIDEDDVNDLKKLQGLELISSTGF